MEPPELVGIRPGRGGPAIPFRLEVREGPPSAPSVWVTRLGASQTATLLCVGAPGQGSLRARVVPYPGCPDRTDVLAVEAASGSARYYGITPGGRWILVRSTGAVSPEDVPTRRWQSDPEWLESLESGDPIEVLEALRWLADGPWEQGLLFGREAFRARVARLTLSPDPWIREAALELARSAPGGSRAGS